jgi:PIN domain nuclease of toxin-antitoxin system
LLTSEFLEGAAMSTVNFAEVQTRLVRVGDDRHLAWEDIFEIVPAIHPFTIEHARIAGNLIASTSRIGLSL